MDVDWGLVADALAGYELGDELGRGASGVVRAGVHRSLGRRVAVKVLATSTASAEARRRFLDEAQLLAGFDHPHLVPVYDFVEAGPQLVLVMEQLDRTVAEVAALGMPPAAACAVIVGACSGLQYAHERGVLHRDVKPENLLLTARSVVKVGDFGIARIAGGSGEETVAGMVVGTPSYMAPEQVTGGTLTPATDVYGLGCVLFELLSGRRPYSGDANHRDPVAALMHRATTPADPLASVASDVPLGVAAVVDDALALRPDDRPPSTRRLGRALAASATEAWGEGWLDASGYPLVAPGDLLADATPGGVSAGTRGGAERPGVADRAGSRGTAPIWPGTRMWGLAAGLLVLVVGVVAAVVWSGGGDNADDGSTGANDDGPGEIESEELTTQVMGAWSRGALDELDEVLTPEVLDAMQATPTVDPPPTFGECGYTTGVVRTCSFGEVAGDGTYLLDVAHGVASLKVISFERIVYE